ncbi:unnamed protein product, partial [Rotaria magnacalcarata]
YYYRARQLALTRVHPEFEEELMKLSSEPSSSTASTPAVSRSSTPAPPEHDDEASDDEDEHQQTQLLPSQVSSQQVPQKELPSSDSSYKPSFPRAASAGKLPFDKQLRAVAVAAANTSTANEPAMADALDDEIYQITLGTKNQLNLTSASHTIRHDDQIDFGLSDTGDFADRGDHKKQEVTGNKKASAFTSTDSTKSNALQAMATSGDTGLSSNAEDESNAK